jgi:hypothetical protein
MNVLARPFLFGFVMGLGLLSLLGSMLTPPDLPKRFARFHMLVSAETGFFPTPHQVRSIVDADSHPGVIYVIVGGTSVLHGVGQHESLIWTRALQERLGTKYKVINFAQRAGRLNDFGNIAAEYLIQKIAPVIYVADGVGDGFAISYDESFYARSEFQAWLRGYLLPWQPRDSIFWHAFWSPNSKLWPIAIGALLDVAFNFYDLWNYISYEYGGLIWDKLLAGQSFGRRSILHDPDLMPEQYEPLRYQDDFEQAMRIVRSQIISSETRGRALDLVGTVIPPRLRAVTLAVIDLDSPFYRDRLSAEEQKAYVDRVRERASNLAGLGFAETVTPSMNFTAKDYVDRIHLSVYGGQKLAAALAPRIEQLASKLGYLE